MSRRALVLTGLACGAVVVGALLLWFAPWRIFTDVEVHEALPVVEAPAPAATGSGAATPSAAPARTTLAAGEFISHEHETRGSVKVIALADGSRVLRLEGLDTSDGPDLHVWLTDAPVIEGDAGWHVFDDGASVELGALKGNKGNQQYAIPTGTDLDQDWRVVVWCRAFTVSFTEAPLT